MGRLIHLEKHIEGLPNSRVGIDASPTSLVQPGTGVSELLSAANAITTQQSGLVREYRDNARGSAVKVTVGNEGKYEVTIVNPNADPSGAHELVTTYDSYDASKVWAKVRSGEWRES